MFSRIKNLLHAYPVIWVLLGTAILYLPTLPVPFRDPDHIVYFANLGPEHSLWNGLRQIDYSASRIYWKGDDFLFRPLLFVLQAIETAVFSFHYVGWNITNLLLHVLVLWSFYRLLTEISGERVFSALFCALFAFSIAPRGLVTNPHLGGYLAGYFCFFEALRFFYKISKTKTELLRSDLVGYFISTAFSIFFYELTIPFLGAASLYLICARRRYLNAFGQACLFLPFVLYSAAYVPHFFTVNRLTYASSAEAPSLFSLENWKATPGDAHYLVREFIREVFPDTRNAKLLFAAAFAGLFLPTFKVANRTPVFFRVYPFFLMATYAVGLAFFRGTFMRDYYQYLFNTFLALAIFSQMDFSRLSGLRRKSAGFFLSAVLLWNIGHVWVLNYQLFDSYRGPHGYFSKLNRFIREHAREKRLTFRIHNPDKDLDMTCELKEGYPDEEKPVVTKWYSEILYARYYDKVQPRYVLTWTGNDFQKKKQGPSKIL